jgi:DNA-binding MarR family transcriptional regulator
VLSVLRTAAWLLEELGPVFAAHHTTAARFDVLDVLAQLDAPIRPGELKQRLHVPAQTLTGVLDALERKGLLCRLPNPTDRRSVLVEITDAGRAAFADLCPELVAIEETCFAGYQQVTSSNLSRHSEECSERSASATSQVLEVSRTTLAGNTPEPVAAGAGVR